MTKPNEKHRELAQKLTDNYCGHSYSLDAPRCPFCTETITRDVATAIADAEARGREQGIREAAEEAMEIAWGMVNEFRGEPLAELVADAILRAVEAEREACANAVAAIRDARSAELMKTPLGETYRDGPCAGASVWNVESRAVLAFTFAENAIRARGAK